MSPESAATRSLETRLAIDGTLSALLGAGPRTFWGWPSDTLQASDFPRLTFYAFGPAPRRPGFQRVVVRVDTWVWPEGEGGGLVRLEDIDARVRELVDEQSWDYSDHRIYALAGGYRDAPAPPGAPMRRTRDVTMEVGPLS